MLGILNGRIYNNLINWYKMLLLVPNAKKNNTFMEQMLGVTDELKGINLEENLTDAYKNMTSFEKFLSFTKKIKALFRFLLNNAYIYSLKILSKNTNQLFISENNFFSWNQTIIITVCKVIYHFKRFLYFNVGS